MSRAQAIPPEYLKRYCLKGVGELDGLLQVKPELQTNVSFRCINLNARLPADLPAFDRRCCSNQGTIPQFGDLIS